MVCTTTEESHVFGSQQYIGPDVLQFRDFESQLRAFGCSSKFVSVVCAIGVLCGIPLCNNAIFHNGDVLSLGMMMHRWLEPCMMSIHYITSTPPLLRSLSVSAHVSTPSWDFAGQHWSYKEVSSRGLRCSMEVSPQNSDLQVLRYSR
jgi:hypothetical protein